MPTLSLSILLFDIVDLPDPLLVPLLENIRRDKGLNDLLYLFKSILAGAESQYIRTVMLT